VKPQTLGQFTSAAITSTLRSRSRMSSRLVSTFTKSLTFIGLASVLASAFSAFGEVEPQKSIPISEFRWLDEQNDAAQWSKVEAAFGDELKPDEPDPDSLTYDYKHVERVGITNNSALVIVGYRPTTASPDLEYFRAFNFDLVSGLRSSIINPERAGTVPLYMWKWEFSTLARFESSPVPDVVILLSELLGVRTGNHTYLAPVRLRDPHVANQVVGRRKAGMVDDPCRLGHRHGPQRQHHRNLQLFIRHLGFQ